MTNATRRVPGSLRITCVRFALFGLLPSCCTPDQPDRLRLADRVASDAGDTTFEAISASAVIDSAIAINLRGSPAEARAILDSILATPEGVSDSDRGRALSWLAMTAWKLFDLETARREGEESLRFKLDHGLEAQLWRSHNILGLVAWYDGRLADATGHFEEAMRLAAKPVDQASARGNLALTQKEAGLYHEAREGFELQRDVGHEEGDVRVEANALTNLAMLDVAEGDPLAAIERLDRAIPLHRSIQHVDGIQNSLGQLGSAYASLGNLGRAHALYDSATALAAEHGLASEEALNLETMAELYHQVGDARRALALYRRAAELNDRTGYTIELGVDLRAQATLLASLGAVPAALDLARRALEVHTEAGAAVEIINDRVALAELAARDGRHADASREVAEAARLAGEIGIPGLEADVALARAAVAEARGDPAGVLDALAGTAVVESVGDWGRSWQIQAAMMRALSSLGRFTEAAAAGERSIESVERVRSSFGSGILRSAYVDSRRQIYTDLMALWLRLGSVEDAFRVADALRAREIGSNANLLPDIEVARDLREADRLLRRIGDLLSLREEEYNQAPEFQSSLDAELATARTAYESLLVSDAEAVGPRLARGGGASVPVSRIQSALEPGEAVVAYTVSTDRVVVFVVRSDTMHVFRAEVPASELHNLVRLARGLLATPERTNTEGILKELHDHLIRPVTSGSLLQGVERLLIVPDGVLTYMPFAALEDRETGSYLIDDFELAFLPSASALPALRVRPSERRTAPVSSFAPFPDELPYSAQEARAVAGRSGEVRVARDATEQSVRRALARPGVVHLATHGVLNVRNPMFSRIELADGRSGAAEDDGRLEVHEVLSLEIRASLVVLTACDTGTGAAWSTSFDQGADYTTLAQAFLSAGARDVVATLWAVSDRSAAVLGTGFYRELQDHSPVAALARVQRAMIRSSDFAAPFHWAGYRLTGVGR